MVREIVQTWDRDIALVAELIAGPANPRPVRDWLTDTYDPDTGENENYCLPFFS